MAYQKRKNQDNVEKIGVGWKRESKAGKRFLKLSINKEIFIAYENAQKLKSGNELAPDYVIVKYIDEK